MRDKLKGPDTDSSTAAAAHERRLQPGAQGTGRAGDATGRSGQAKQDKLEQNRERLKVGDDHKTREMKKGHRGTFP
ncbi:MAG TPA: hypothetical protein VK043_04375 [Burkholderiales bacterium]|nr:hypothetical protein [Burkholderiales bacterium]